MQIQYADNQPGNNSNIFQIQIQIQKIKIKSKPTLQNWMEFNLMQNSTNLIIT